MAKKVKEKNTAKGQNGFDTASLLGTNARRLGTTIAGVVLTEIVEIAVERLMQKNSSNTHTDANSTNENAASDLSDVVQQAAVEVQDTVGEAKSTAKSAVDVLKSAASEFSPVLISVVDSIKAEAERSLDQSTSPKENVAATVASRVADTAQTVVDAVNPTSSEPSGKKGKKKKKSKK